MMKKYKKFYLEITNQCNLDCTFCPPSSKKKQFMKKEAFEQVLIKIKCFTDYIYLHVKGEPLLHPDLEAILKLCEKYELQVNITTNGTLLNEKLAILLSSKAVRLISISLQSMENEDIEAKNHYISKIFEAVHLIRNKSSIICEFRLWNLHEMGGEVVLRNTNYLKKIQNEFELSEPIAECVNKSKGIKIAERLFVSQSYEFTWPNMELPEGNGKGFCYGLKNQIAILVDGSVVPCCLDAEGEMLLGNIFEIDDFETIVKCNRAQEIVKGFSENKLVEKLCRTCGYRKRFEPK